MSAILDALRTVLDEEHARAVVEHRRALRKPLTPHSAELLARQFARCFDPNEGADEMMMRGWVGFKIAWVRERDMARPEAPRPNSTGNSMIDALYSGRAH